jgi:hypothetical protein
MKAEPPVRLLEFATVFIPATLVAFLIVTAVVWTWALWVCSLLPEIGNGG